MKKFLCVPLLLVSLGCSLAEEKRLWAKSILDKKAPELVVEEWLSEEPNTEGKFVLIDFWATWCGPCLKAIPKLNAFHEQFGDRLVVIGISDEPADKVRSLKSQKMEYFSAVDTKATTKKELEVSGIPHVVVVDPEGIVRWEGYPLLRGHELTAEVLQEVFAKYGDGQPKEEASE